MQFRTARPRGPWLGWGTSLLAHACLLAWLVHAVAPSAPPAAPAESMHFVLVPPKAQAVAPAAVDAAPAAPAAARTDRVERNRPLAGAPDATPVKAASTEAPPMAPAQDTEDAPAAAASIPPAGIEAAPEPGAEGKLDMPAAIKTARLVDGHRKDSLVAFPKPEPPLKRDDRLERAINRAHRDLDCKKAYSALGLLAVIPLAKDTLTGTGCRW